MQNPYQWQKIVFFDGVCILCNRAVDFLLKRDHKKKLKFAALQSVNTTAFIRNINNQPLKENTIVFYNNGRLYIKSTAVLKIAGSLGLPYSAFALLIIIPRPLRDGIYDLIARNRAKWFGTRENCRVPDHETMSRFID